jgi:ankyrin repeat protein
MLLKNKIILFCTSAARKLLALSPELVNVTKEDGFTSLHLAAVNDHCEIAEIILAQVSFLFQIVLPFFWYLGLQ